MKKRMTAALLSLAVCFSLLLIRIIELNTKKYSEAARQARTKTIEIAETRGKIYDRNLKPLVDSEERLVAAASPDETVYEALRSKFGESEALRLIREAKPLIFEPDTELNNDSIRTFHVPVRYGSDSCAVHLIGYVDRTTQNGLSGIEKAYNTFLSENGGTLSVSFETDANGKTMPGLDKTVNDNNFNSKAGVVLTIDKRIQLLTEKALSQSTIKSGSAVVMHIGTGEIYAMASIPGYDPENLAKSLSSKLSPFVNKALKAYSVGSVFKPLVAAAALENGIGEKHEYECKGYIDVGDVRYECFSKKAHGRQTMKEALENSCNTYFINLLSQSDPELLLSLCRSLGFSSETVIADGIKGAKGVLPDSDDFIYPGERANFAFGQGKLLATPLQMLNAYHALATGNSINPTVIRGFADSSALLKLEESRSNIKKIFSASTVKKMRKMLSSVVENGNASKAASGLLSLAGKTGTAQSGIYVNGEEICRTWFCGFFPAENPHYIVVILNEDGESGSADCAPVFKRICEGIVRENG